MTATFHPEWVQYTTVYLGSGGMGESITAMVHRACGAMIGDVERHMKVCTAPPWEPTPINFGETQDFNSDGTIEKRTS